MKPIFETIQWEIPRATYDWTLNQGHGPWLPPPNLFILFQEVHCPVYKGNGCVYIVVSSGIFHAWNENLFFYYRIRAARHHCHINPNTQTLVCFQAQGAVGACLNVKNAWICKSTTQIDWGDVFNEAASIFARVWNQLTRLTFCVTVFGVNQRISWSHEAVCELHLSQSRIIVPVIMTLIIYSFHRFFHINLLRGKCL